MKLVSVVGGLVAIALLMGFKSATVKDEEAQSYIISAKNFTLLKNNLKELGATPTHELKNHRFFCC